MKPYESWLMAVAYLDALMGIGLAVLGETPMARVSLALALLCGLGTVAAAVTKGA